MNDLFPEITIPKEVEAFCAAHAEAIRVLAKRAAGDIVEIGQRLIAVKNRLGHARWLPWLADEFDWSQPTAFNFMRVADHFGSKLSTVDNLEIDATALYLLARDEVPEAIRDQVIERAVAGEHITKAKAEEMVADAVATAKRQTAEEKEREFREAYAKWEAAQPKKLKQETPDVKTIRRDLCKVLDRKDLTADQWRWLAQILGETIAVGNRQYQPVSKAEIAANEENLRIASAITVAFETLAGAPPPVALKAATWPVQRKQHKRVGPQIIAWLTEYMAVLEGED